MRKGFTLVELIITILIVGIIAVIISPVINSTIKDSKQKAYNTTVQNIKTSASMYSSEFMDSLRWFVSSNETGDESDEEWTCVQIKKLIEKGYLKDTRKSESEIFVVNPENDGPTSVNDFVELRRNKNNYGLLRDKVTLESGNCNGYDTTNPEINIQLALEDGTVYNGQTPIWTDQNVIQTITASDANGITSLQIKKGTGEYEDILPNEKNENSWISKLTQTEEIDLAIKIRAIDYFGHETEKGYKLLIDKNDPTCSINLNGTKASDSNDWYTSDVEVVLTSEDISQVNYDLSTVDTPTYNNASKTFNQIENTTGITYYAHVKDQVGHTNSCSATVKKDSVTPTAPALSAYPSTFTKSSSSPSAIPPTTAKFGVSGGTTSCTCNGSVCTNLNSVANGKVNIVCTSTANNGLSATTNRTITVTSCTPKTRCNTCGGTESNGCGGRISCYACPPPPTTTTTKACQCVNWYQCGTGYTCSNCECILNTTRRNRDDECCGYYTCGDGYCGTDCDCHGGGGGGGGTTPTTRTPDPTTKKKTTAKKTTTRCVTRIDPATGASCCKGSCTY